MRYDCIFHTCNSVFLHHSMAVNTWISGEGKVTSSNRIQKMLVIVLTCVWSVWVMCIWHKISIQKRVRRSIDVIDSYMIVDLMLLPSIGSQYKRAIPQDFISMCIQVPYISTLSYLETKPETYMKMCNWILPQYLYHRSILRRREVHCPRQYDEPSNSRRAFFHLEHNDCHSKSHLSFKQPPDKHQTWENPSSCTEVYLTRSHYYLHINSNPSSTLQNFLPHDM